MASHTFKVQINKNPGDPPSFPHEVEIKRCTWCDAWYLSMFRLMPNGIGITYGCPACQIEELEERIDKFMEDAG